MKILKHDHSTKRELRRSLTLLGYFVWIHRHQLAKGTRKDWRRYLPWG